MDERLPFQVRKARPDDAPQLHHLNEGFNGIGETTVDRVEDSLRTNPSEFVFVAESDGRLVGFACSQRFHSMCYDVEYSEVTELFVAEEFRRLGVARSLLEATENAFRSIGVNHFQLFTKADNFGAQAFYECSGYKRSTEVLYRKRP